MSKLNNIGIGIGILLIPIVIGLYSLGIFKIMAPLQKDIQREVFENTKSYIHGVQQDLGKYYHEYQNADANGKDVIAATIRMRFAEVDAEKLQSNLKQFLIQTRGY